MKFYLQTRDGKRRKLKTSEVQEYLSKSQIEDAKAAKLQDPQEEVSYMAANGAFVIVE